MLYLNRAAELKSILEAAAKLGRRSGRSNKVEFSLPLSQALKNGTTREEADVNQASNIGGYH